MARVYTLLRNYLRWGSCRLRTWGEIWHFLSEGAATASTNVTLYASARASRRVGQARVLVLLLRKDHLGEVGTTVRPPALQEVCEQHNVRVLG